MGRLDELPDLGDLAQNLFGSNHRIIQHILDESPLYSPKANVAKVDWVDEFIADEQEKKSEAFGKTDNFIQEIIEAERKKVLIPPDEARKDYELLAAKLAEFESKTDRQYTCLETSIKSLEEVIKKQNEANAALLRALHNKEEEHKAYVDQSLRNTKSLIIQTKELAEKIGGYEQKSSELERKLSDQQKTISRQQSEIYELRKKVQDIEKDYKSLESRLGKGVPVVPVVPVIKGRQPGHPSFFYRARNYVKTHFQKIKRPAIALATILSLAIGGALLYKRCAPITPVDRAPIVQVEKEIPRAPPMMPPAYVEKEQAAQKDYAYQFAVKDKDTLWWTAQRAGIKGNSQTASFVNELVAEQKNYSADREFLGRINRDFIYFDNEGKIHYANPGQKGDSIAGDFVKKGDKFTVPQQLVQKYSLNESAFEKVETRQEKKPAEQAPQQDTQQTSLESRVAQHSSIQPSNYAPATTRESNVLSMYSKGHSVDYIGSQLNSSSQDVKSVLANYFYSLKENGRYAKTVRQIGDELNLGNIYKHLDKGTVKRREQLKQAIEARRSLVLNDYRNGVQAASLAGKYNVSKSTVYRDLRQALPRFLAS